MVTIPRRDYAALYGPTTGDGVRLADTSLVAVVEHDHRGRVRHRRFHHVEVLRQARELHDPRDHVAAVTRRRRPDAVRSPPRPLSRR